MKRAFFNPNEIEEDDEEPEDINYVLKNTCRKCDKKKKK